MSFFPIVVQELSPLFRIIDEASRPSPQQCAPRAPCFPAAVRQRSFEKTFQPRFDVVELKDSYELMGELPGVEQKDIKVEWTDGNTLAISGHLEPCLEKKSPALAPATEKAVEEKPHADAASYHAPSVEEDEDDGELISKPGDSDTEPTTTSSPPEKSTTTIAADPETSIPDSPVEQRKYWVSERRSGPFSRSFKFPGRIEQENVRASLKNGILSIVVPKAAIPAPRTIVVE